jgi:hypothetical protein
MPLVTFGDSWPYGSELAEGQHPYGHVLASLLQMPFTNCAVPATSNEHMILQLNEYASANGSINGHVAIFFLTWPGRSCWIDYNGYPKEIRPDANADKTSLEYQYFKYFHTPNQEVFRTHQSMLSLQRMSSALDLQDFYIVGWTPNIDFNWPGIDTAKIYKSGDTTCASWLGISSTNFETDLRSSPYVLPNVCHPNQLGHQLIAEKLYNWMKDKIV